MFALHLVLACRKRTACNGYDNLRNGLSRMKMHWVTETSIEVRTSRWGSGCSLPWTKLKILLQPASIEGKPQTCLFIGTVEGKVDLLLPQIYISVTFCKYASTQMDSRVTVSGCKGDQANETIVTLPTPGPQVVKFTPTH